MKKALLMTWFNTPNYGTLLQCDATVSLLEERYGIEVDVANYTPIGKRDAASIVKKVFSLRTWKRRIGMVIGYIRQRKEDKGFEMKQKMVDDFVSHYTFALNGKQVWSDEDFQKLNDAYSVFVSGSDQIWNPDFLNERFLLDFVSADKQCISVASSVSKKEIDPQFIEIYEKFLPKYQAITVREQGNVEQLKAISGKEVYAVLDPTILYGAENWKKWIIPNDKADYTLVYILGKSEEIRTIAVNYSQNMRKELYFFPHMDGMYTDADNILKNSGTALWGESPYRWLGWIDNAGCIITDSFHMTVFSLMFHKNFYVVPKEQNCTSQNNRIWNLLRKVGLTDRFVGFDEILDKINENSTIDWNRADAALYEERQKSLAILDSVVDQLRWNDDV